MLRVEIVGGPNKMGLMLGLFDPMRGVIQKRRVDFKIKGQVSPGVVYHGPKSIQAIIYGCSRENLAEDGESWDIKGAVVFPWDRKEGEITFTARYSTRSRIGIMDLEL